MQEESGIIILNLKIAFDFAKLLQQRGSTFFQELKYFKSPKNISAQTSKVLSSLQDGVVAQTYQQYDPLLSLVWAGEQGVAASFKANNVWLFYFLESQIIVNFFSPVRHLKFVK